MDGRETRPSALALRPAQNCRKDGLRSGVVRPSTPLTSQSAAVTWRLPYVVALLLDAPATLLR